MRSAVIIAALLLATPASAYTIRATSYCDEVHVPPAEYDYEPTAPYTLSLVPPFAVTAMCDSSGASPIGRIGACMNDQGEDHGIIIWMRNDLTPGEYACVMRHEKAHVNGWRHDYEKTKPVPRGRIGFLPKYTPVP